MTNTTNFNFLIPDGSDNVNLLTQNYPNWTSLDAILKGIKDTGVTTATATKTGTNFAVVRNDTDCNFFRFVATANYVAGDTFTVDGVPVTATSAAGTALPSGAFVINQSVIAIVNSGVLTVLVGGGLSSVDAGDVDYDNTGSGLTATDVQAAIDEVQAEITALPPIPTSFDAADVTYDNTVSGLTATDVQAAIDEIIASYASPVMKYATLTLNQSSTFSFTGKSEFSYDSATVNNVTYSMELRDTTTNTQVYRWLSNESVGAIALDNTHTYKIQPNGSPANCSVTFTNLVIV